MNKDTSYPYSNWFLPRRPGALANLRGSRNHPRLHGTVRFYQSPHGVLVVTEVLGLPMDKGLCQGAIFALHIHEGGSCTGNADDPFANALTHYNPHNCPHPYHAGDMPPLFGANGHAFGAFLTNRFTIPEILGRTVILHGSPDDFTTQPAGNAGIKIACGVIERA